MEPSPCGWKGNPMLCTCATCRRFYSERREARFVAAADAVVFRKAKEANNGR